MTYLALLLAAASLAAVLWRRPRGDDVASERFWRDLAVAAVCGFTATAIKLTIPSQASHDALILTATGIDALAYAFVAMAAGRQPYQVSPWQLPRLLDHWMRPGVLIAVVCAWGYAMLIPALVFRDPATPLDHSHGLFIGLAAYVTIRLGAEAVGAANVGSTYWRRVFRRLTVASILWLTSRILRADWLPIDDALATYGSIALTLAAAASLVSAALAPRPSTKAATPTLWASPRATPVRTTLHTVVFALVFPVAHTVLYAFGSVPEEARSDRERLVLLALVLLGGLALVQRTLLGRRAAALTAEHRRIETMIRQHQTNIELSEARRSATTSIRNVTDRFERIFRACPSLMMIVNARDGQILEVNESFERMVRLPRHAAIGQHARRYGLWPARNDPTPWTQALKRGATVQDQRLVLTNQEGGRHVVRVSGATVSLEGGTGYVFLAREVTDHEAEQGDTTRHASWIDEASVPMLVLDEHDQLSAWSHGAATLFETDLSDARGASAAPLFGGIDAASWSHNLEQARSGGQAFARMEALVSPDRGLPVACRFAALAHEEASRHVLCVLTPVGTWSAEPEWVS